MATMPSPGLPHCPENGAGPEVLGATEGGLRAAAVFGHLLAFAKLHGERESAIVADHPQGSSVRLTALHWAVLGWAGLRGDTALSHIYVGHLLQGELVHPRPHTRSRGAGSVKKNSC